MTPAWIDAGARVLAAVSWPAVVIGIFWMFRTEISSLLKRVKALTWADKSVQLNEELKNKISDAEEQLAESEEGESGPSRTDLIDLTMSDMIQNMPREAIRFSWERVQDALNNCANANQISIDLRSIRRSADQLSEVGAISAELAEAVKKLHSTFKMAIRVDVFDLEADTVEHYVRLALETRRALEERARVPAS